MEEKTHYNLGKRVIVSNLSKTFKIGFRKKQSALARFLDFFSGIGGGKTLEVLRGPSFEVNRGEILGVIGKNGCGKSTLLRVLSGIYGNYSGDISIFGRVIPLIGLGVGMELRMTLKDNVFLLGSLFGMGKKEIKEKFDMIVGFADLKDFVNTKVFQFSEGMKQRLAFSIAIHANPDILLLDEILAVGDENFRNKGVERIKELVKRGASVIFVSHELWMLESFCDRIMWIDGGNVIRIAKTKKEIGEIIQDYKNDSKK